MKEFLNYVLIILCAFGLYFAYLTFLPVFFDSNQTSAILDYSNNNAAISSFVLYPFLLSVISSLSNTSIFNAALLLNALLFLITFFCFKSLYKRRFEVVSLLFITVPVIQIFGSISTLPLMIASLIVMLTGFVNYYRKGRLFWLSLIFLGALGALFTSLLGLSAFFCIVIYYIVFRHADKRPEITFIGITLFLLLILYGAFLVFQHKTSGLSIPSGSDSFIVGILLFFTSLIYELNFMIAGTDWSARILWLTLIPQVLFFIWFIFKFWPHFNLALAETRAKFTNILVIACLLSFFVINTFFLRSPEYSYSLFPIVFFGSAIFISSLSSKITKSGFNILKTGILLISIVGHLIQFIFFNF